MKKCFIVLLCIFHLNYAWTDEHKEIKHETDLLFMFATNIQMEIDVEHRIIFPFSLGSNFLTKQNNITAKFGLELSPMTLKFSTSAVWMPLPFLNFTIGSEIGSGWNYNLYGFPLKGLGLYQYDENTEPSEWVLGDGLDGVLWKLHGGVSLLFNLSAFVHGDWNHLVMKIDNSLRYQDYTKADSVELWFFKGGISQNRLSYYFSVFIGYQMPIFLRMTGFMFEMDMPFYNPQSGKVLNYDAEMLFTFLLDFKIGNYFSILALTEIGNHLIRPIMPHLNREWKFSCVRLIATWHLKY